ncbi:PDR/VanB family oxidoreductase [Cupriavidus numazuensis]|uniref:Phenoxybenzoate dioxygenase subunit beta n=1 Tax=Cupriavidus numazuensis TaxID=221992 RepID=A0ABM8TRP8_9BURK|nr:PDR/VanB family oxidoreductase [Cupriavidus numazuensis]CAG2158920.1 Phenoxybenzoate dioxygenase subunit beta [Cupriavidus numazuensis]
MQKLNAILHAAEWLADGIMGFDFRPTDDAVWPTPTAGAHIDVHLPNGLMRSYSLTNRPGESKRYLVAVHRDGSGGGGSKFMHDCLRVGQKLQLSAPRNNFPLAESGATSILIAGGIGITPIWSMVQRLAEIDAPWTVHYASRSRETAAFVDELEELACRSRGTVHLNFDGGVKERRLDLDAIVAAGATDAEFYCCGPSPMLRAFAQACKSRPAEKVHLEYFAAPTQPAQEGSADGPFSVVLSKSNLVLDVGPQSTILETLLSAGVEAPYSCMAGICRACEVSVLAGTPDHRDFVLSDAEKTAGDKIIICCSRAKSQELVLDL